MKKGIGLIAIMCISVFGIVGCAHNSKADKADTMADTMVDEEWICTCCLPGDIDSCCGPVTDSVDFETVVENVENQY